MSVFKKRQSVFLYTQRVVAMCIVAIFVTFDVGSIFTHPFVLTVSAAEVTIDSSPSTIAPSHNIGQPAIVFISDQVGYKFYRDGTGGTGTNGTCVYRKTTNGGTSWGSENVVDSQTDCESVVVWYDQWTPGDTGSYIHIATMDSGNDDIWYNRLDTSNDTLLLGSSPVSVVLSQGSLSLSAATANHSMTKGTDGKLHVAVADNGDRFMVTCSSSCGVSGNWSESGDGTFMDADEDRTILLPLDSGSILLINRDITANEIRSKVWNGSSWSASWSSIDSSAVESSVYDIGMSAVRSPVSGDIHLVYLADNDNSTADHDIRIAKYSSGSWSNLSDFTTNDTRGLTTVSLAIDANTDTVYLAFSAQTTIGSAGTGEVYWATSTSAMTSWSPEQGPVNSSSGDIQGVNMNYYSTERMFVTWFDATADNVIGDTIEDISPATEVSTVGTQVSDARASSTNFYTGGAFVIEESTAARNVTEITISEAGTVNAATAIDNIKLFYDLDTDSPYDCADESYGGTEPQFGSTDTDGFSSSNGTSTFSGSVSISPTQAMCVYVVVDILKTAPDQSTLDIEIANPMTDVLVSGGVTAIPATTQSITSYSTIYDSDLTQTHFHWRNHDGNETGATSATAGSEDTSLTAVQQEVPKRLRLGVSNEGSTSTLPVSLQLEYALNTSSCDVATGWTDVGESNDEWNMYDSTHITNADDTTDIDGSVGGVTNENSVFLSPNGGLRDTASSLGSLTLLPTNWTEVEFSVVASTSATEGNTYCFRLTNAGEPLPSYTNYPEATIAADVLVQATGTQIATVDIPTTDFYVGGAFSITEKSTSRNVTAITITESGTVDAASGVSNVRLYYDLDTSLPYDCGSESYSGTELQFGSASTSFSDTNGHATFVDSVNITTTQAMCVYPVVDITESAANNETLNISINSPETDVMVSNSGSVEPASSVDIMASTTIQGGVVTLTHYHWRNDNGNETGATSATGGTEDTPLVDFTRNSEVRLRIGISNEGATTSLSHSYGLEYGIKNSTCEAITTWSDVDGGGNYWTMYDSLNLTNGETTTNISVANGGVSDENTSFLTANGNVRDTESFSATTTLTKNEHVDLEYSIASTNDIPYETDFCFRLTKNGSPLLSYDQYPELSMEVKRDFKIQRGVAVVSGTSSTLTAGVDYDAPSASTSAFVRITNSHFTGAGKNTLGGNQNTDDYAAYISNPGNIETSFTISRDTDSTDNTYVAWEIVEYVGPAGGDNEIFVRGQSAVSYSSLETVATGTAVSNITDDSDVVVFVTGQLHEGGNRSEGYAHQSTAAWSADTDEPVFERGATGSNVGYVSYAVVEFVGMNWKVQRAEHTYNQAGVAETESITAVNSLARTFVHSQKRYEGSIAMADFGHQVWLSSIGAVSFFLDSNAATTSNHVSVAWIVENTQIGEGEMLVQRSNGNTTGGSEPLTLSVDITTPLNAVGNSSIFLTTSLDSTGNQYPRMIAGASILSTTTYQIWRSDTGDVLSYRTEIVQWPAANLAVRQNYYRLYVNNELLKPTDPWPVGGVDLGENTPISVSDEPLANNDRVRIRLTAKITNATMPSGLLEMKLQYGLRDTTCSAVAVWNDLGAPGSGSAWRGYDVSGVTDGVSLSGNPPTGGDLLISVSDRAGRYVESNPSNSNEFAAYDGENIEYDWVVEQNGALQRSTYCFRMVHSDGNSLDGYLYYPQVRTEGFTPVVDTWRWYDDEANETPVSSLANENITPSGLFKGNAVKLRVSLAEIKDLTQVDADFKLQFSTEADFSDVQDVVSTSTCTNNSIWCYYNGVDTDGSTITTSVLSGSDSCIAGSGDGCGTHAESATYQTGFTHYAGKNTEYEFTLLYTDGNQNYGQVYYFRLYDLANDEIINASTTDPSIVGQGASLAFTIDGVDSGVTIGDIVTDATTTAATINFGSVPLDTDIEVAQQLTVDTNAIEGYQVYTFADQQLLDSYANQILPITSSNPAPQSWSVACSASAVSCFGYHTTDATLENASGRFAPVDSYAALNTALDEVMYSSVAAVDTEEIVYRIRVSQFQEIGDYQTSITYVVVPVF